MDQLDGTLAGTIVAGALVLLKLGDKFFFESRARGGNGNGSKRHIELLEEIRDGIRVLIDLAKDSTRDHKSLAGQMGRIEDKVRK